MRMGCLAFPHFYFIYSLAFSITFYLIFLLSQFSVLPLPVIDLLVLWTLIFPASCPVDLVHAIKLLRGQAQSFVI